MSRVNGRAGEVHRAARAMAQAPDTRAIKRELQRGNPYLVELMHRRGLGYVRGSGLVRMREVER
jgi:hypothetical protein